MTISNLKKRIRHGSVLTFALGTLLLGTAASAQKTDKFELKVSQSRQAVQNEPVKVTLEYSVKQGDLAGPGLATANYHNVDTGQDFIKTAEAPLTKGNHKLEFTWGDGQTMPTGMYVVQATIKDAAGQQVAAYHSDPASVNVLTLTGRATRMVDPATLAKQAEQFPVWRKELEELEAKAKALGINTAREHILIVTLQQAEKRTKEQLTLKWYTVLAANYDFLSEKVPQTKAALEKMIEHPEYFQDRAATPRSDQRYQIKGQYFYAGDKPVFLCGPAFFNFTLGELPVASELGFNIIEVSTGPNSVFPNSDTPTREPLAIDYNDTMQTGKITDVLDKCAKLGLKIDLGLTMHFMPKWFFEKYPDAKNNSPNFMMPYDIEHPEVRKLTDKFYDYVMPLIAHHPALNSIWVVNEPGYMNPNERNMAIFRPWLQEKYKTVAGLNAAWGTTLKSFDEVAAGKERAYIPNGVTTAAAQADWWRYTSERVTLHFQHMRDLVHKYDPELPVSVKLFNATFNPQFKPPMRVNEEPVFDSMAYMGYDGGSYPFSKSYKDFIRSLNPDKPMGNLEYKFGAQRSPIDFWQEAMQGAALINWWCWHPKYTFSPAPSYARALYYAAIEMQDIQRLLPQIMAFNKGPRAPMALLYPNPAISFDREYFNVSQGVNETLTWMGYNVDYVSEKRVAQGRLDDYRAIIMPSANYIQDETYQKVQAFIAKGGTAIVLGALPEHDELGHARNADFFKSTTNKALDMDGAKAYVYSAGKGTIYHLPELPRVPSSNNANKLSDSATPIIKAYLETTLQQSVPQQPVVIRNCENRTVAYKDEKGEKVYLTYLVNDSFDNELVVQPKFNFKVKSARDLISTRQVNPNKIVLAPLTVMMVRFTIAK